jgi:hypothetical protein
MNNGVFSVPCSRRVWLDLAMDLFAILMLGAHQIVVQLEA